MFRVLKRTVSMKNCLEHPKNMLKYMNKKKFTILRTKTLFNLTFYAKMIGLSINHKFKTTIKQQ